MAEALDKMKAGMVAGYGDKSGRAEDDIAALMAAETWLSAQEAVELGLADRVEEPVGWRRSSTSPASATRRRSSRRSPPPSPQEDDMPILRRKRTRAVQRQPAGKTPEAESGHAWQAASRRGAGPRVPTSGAPVAPMTSG